MKKALTSAAMLLFLILGLSGCGTVGEKSQSLTIIYAATTVLSLALLAWYCCAIKKKNAWFVLLFSSVSVVNIGYFCLAASSSLGGALLANRVAYLGSVLLPLSMLMIILHVTNTPYKTWLPWCLFGLSAVVFFIAASPGYLDIYYKEVSFAIVNGAAKLIKVYGPLHPLYLFFLLGYFAVMITVIVRAQAKKTIDTLAHAIMMIIAVFVNIGVWFIEQLVSIEFEMLSVSYLISELFLLGANLLTSETQRLKELIREKEQSVSAKTSSPPVVDMTQDAITLFLEGYGTLTPREYELFHAYVAGKSTKEILGALGIKENTLKYHSRNLYGKLGVSSRKQLTAVYNHLCASGATFENANDIADQ